MAVSSVTAVGYLMITVKKLTRVPWDAVPQTQRGHAETDLRASAFPRAANAGILMIVAATPPVYMRAPTHGFAQHALLLARSVYPWETVVVSLM